METADTKEKSLLRKKFEASIQQSPYERSVTRLGPSHSWPGQYVEYEVQLAWEFFQAGAAIPK